jgi:hypothetical protein
MQAFRPPMLLLHLVLSPNWGSTFRVHYPHHYCAYPPFLTHFSYVRVIKKHQCKFDILYTLYALFMRKFRVLPSPIDYDSRAFFVPSDVDFDKMSKSDNTYPLTPLHNILSICIHLQLYVFLFLFFIFFASFLLWSLLSRNVSGHNKPCT